MSSLSADAINLTVAQASCSSIPYICEICGYIIEDLNDLRVHLKGHSAVASENAAFLLESYQQMCDDKRENNKIDNEEDKKLTSTLNDNASVDYQDGCDLPNGQPYRFTEDANSYVCNLCQCSYDSLRSMKAHLWKHSGHHSLSYPIRDAVVGNEDLERIHNENSVESTTFKPPIVHDEEIIATSEITIEMTTAAVYTPDTSITSSPSKIPSNISSPSSTRASGICSVLLEVIEKLRDEESDDMNSKFAEDNEDTVCKKNNKRRNEGKKIKIEDCSENKVKRGRKRKVKELIDENSAKEASEADDETEKLNAKNTKTQNKIVNNEAAASSIIKTKKPANDTKKQQLNYLCVLCKKIFLNKINLEMHKITDCIKADKFNTIPESTAVVAEECKQDKYEAVYACDLCEFKCLIKENLVDHLTKGHNERLKNTVPLQTPAPINEENALLKSNEKAKQRFVSPLIQSNLPTLISNVSSAPTQRLIINNTSSSNSNKFVSLLISLATNDGYEQYVCGLCPYVCYHLPSLKSHMWTHVTNRKFDYSLNTTIINAALDYENKLNRQLLALNNTNGNSISSPFSDLTNPYELINYPLSNKTTSNGTSPNSCDKPMVSFRCSKCGYSTINLSLLRLHKRQHYIKIISPNAAKIQLNKITSDKDAQQQSSQQQQQKLVINS